MSTSTDPVLPDIDALRNLANHFFNALPGHHTNQIQQHPEVAASRTPVSVSGIGASPGALNSVNAIDLHNRDSYSPENIGNVGKNPPSAAGSGIQSSAHHQYNEVDISNPQTAHADPHFGNGSQPANDNGKPKIGFFGRDQFFVPHPAFDPYLPGLAAVIPLLKPDPAEPQIPFIPAADPFKYYFVHQQNINSNHRQAQPPFDINQVRNDFPILNEKVNGKPLVWLDNAATTQKPKQVIDRISYFYEHENSNIHRAAHELAARATDAYEASREKVRRFLNARSTNEIIFVRGTTEAINLIAKAWGEKNLQQGDEIILSHLEHHANIVPWQQLAEKKRIKIRVIPVDEDGQLIIEEYAKLLNSKTKFVSFTQVSNALGTITPAKQIIDMAHSNGSKVLLDGAQSVSHLQVDLQSLNPDFFVFSGHKIFGPTGIGVVYGREEILNDTVPWQGGGNMIKDVTFEHTEFHAAPTRFEAGTGNIADAVGLGAALDYVSSIGIPLIHQYEHALLNYAIALMNEIPGLRFIGTAAEKASVLSFTLKGYNNDDIGKALNKEGIAVRTGHHCAQPILRRFGVETTVRPSLAFYNTCAEIDLLVSVLRKLKNY